MSERPSLEEHAEADALRKALRDSQRQLAKAKAKTEDLVEASISGAMDAMMALGSVPQVPTPEKDKRSKGEEVALLHLTDWQGSKVTSSYNSEVMRRRVLQCLRGVEKVTAVQRADHPIRKLAILFGGDMVEGLFNFPTQPFEIDATLHEQWQTVSRLEVDVVRWALSVFEEVQVFSEWGNHGRIGSKRSTVPRADNFDRMTYTFARELLAVLEPDRVQWSDGPDDIQHVEIGNYRALLIHGDEIGRNGFASRNTIVQHCNRWRSGAHRWAFRDVYVGHYHVHGEEALANGEGSVYWTGSTESDNRYAGDTLASSALPSQRLHFVDPDKGRVTAQYKLWLHDE